MPFQKKAGTELENFEDLWSLGDPVVIEREFRNLLPRAKALKDKSLYLQILSQIALTQALQKKFDDAHKTLDDAEKLLTANQHLARVRITLERGRVFQQADDLKKTRLLFKKAFELSTQYKFDYHTINVAHMIAIVAPKTDEKIKWNKLAIELAEKSKDQKAHAWFGPLYHNVGQNFLEAKQYENALSAFKKALKFRKEEGYQPNIRVAKMAVGRALRSLGHLDEALTIQTALLKEYHAITQSGNFDMPEQMFKLVRGILYEELAEIYDAKAKIFSTLAYNDLSKDPMFSDFELKRLERLKHMQN